MYALLILSTLEFEIRYFLPNKKRQQTANVYILQLQESCKEHTWQFAIFSRDARGRLWLIIPPKIKMTVTSEMNLS